MLNQNVGAVITTKMESSKSNSNNLNAKSDVSIISQ